MTHTITRDKKAAALVASFLVLGVLGTATLASAAQSGERRADLTDEERTVLQEVRELVRSGDIDEARDMLEDSDLSYEIKDRVNDRLDRHERREAIKEALENNDYDTFVALTADAPFADQVDEDFFEALQEAHELREAGDKEGAREVLEEAGIDLPHKHKGHKGGHGPRGDTRQ